MNRIAGTLIAGFAALLLGAASASTARAQDETDVTPVESPRQGTQAVPPQQPLRSLNAALKSLYWNSPQRGPLLVVAPERSGVWQPHEKHEEIYRQYTPPQPLYAPKDPNLRAENIAPYFGRKVVHCGTLTVLAPLEMVLLNNQLPAKPDPMVGMSRSDKLRLIQGSLTPAQWRALGSSAGLGADDLDGEQKTLFLSLLPNPMKLVHGKSNQWGGIEMNWNDPNSQATLSDGQRNGIRIRLTRTTQINLMSTQNQQVNYYTDVRRYKDGDDRWIINSTSSSWNSDEQYGVKLRAWVPSRLKTGDIDFDAPALEIPVSFGGQNGPKTVGDLVAAVREKTGAELYADGRAGRLKLWWDPEVAANGGQAKAGDILKALSWAVTGVFRRVGPDEQGKSVYILSDDVEGIGTRRARIATWIDTGQFIQQKLTADINKKIAAKKPIEYINYGEKDPWAPGDALASKIQDSWKTQKGRYSGVTAYLGELNDSMRAQVRAALAQNDKLVKDNPQISNASTYADRVLINEVPKMSYIIPGIGEVESEDAPWDNLTSMLAPPATDGYDLPSTSPYANWKPSPYPSRMPDGLPNGTALCVSPATVEEAVASVEAAKRRGMKSVWVQITDPDMKSSLDLLKATIEAGRSRKIAVYAIIRLMMVGGAETPAGVRDTNILGETGIQFAQQMLVMYQDFPTWGESYRNSADWLRPDAPETPGFLQKRLSAIASLPGIAGIVFKTAATPGYDKSEKTESYYSFRDSGSDFGYDAQNRVALIRKAGYDPVDLSSRYYFVANLTLPNFSQNDDNFQDENPWEQPLREPLMAWNGIRYAKQMELLKTVYRNFRAAFPTTPLLISNPGLNNDNGGMGVAAWENADTLPDFSLADTTKQFASAIVAAQKERTAAAAAKAPPAKPKPPEPMAFARPKTRLWMTYIGPNQIHSVDTSSIFRPFQPIEPDSTKAFSLALSSNLRLLEVRLKPPGAPAGKANPSNIDGLVLDLTALPMDQALRYVQEGIAPDPGAAK